MQQSGRAHAFGYKKGFAVDDLFYVLFEAVCYAARWQGASLWLFMMDVESAFDSVRHDDVLDVFAEAGACPRQLLSIARSMANNHVMLDIPDVFVFWLLAMTKAFKNGGKTEPEKFGKRTF